MFRQMKVDLVGMVENMSYFVCPHCHHQTDIFSRGGAERTAEQFDVAYLGESSSIPISARPATAANPWCSPERDRSGKIALRFARKVVARVDEIKANAGERVIQIQ